MTKIMISFNDQQLQAEFFDSDTTEALLQKMPLNLNMMNLYSRELTYRFSEALPARKAKTSGYEVGDIGYWKPMHSFVIFYKQTGEVIDQLQIVGHINGDLSKLQATDNDAFEFKIQ